jgi:hypothetical protein
MGTPGGFLLSADGETDKINITVSIYTIRVFAAECSIFQFGLARAGAIRRTSFASAALALYSIGARRVPIFQFVLARGARRISFA